METTTQTQAVGFLERNRNIIKGFIIGFLILVMLIPTAFIQDLVHERQGRQEEVVQEISSKWAGGQVVVGPVLAIPYRIYDHDKDGKVIESRSEAYLLPELLKVSAAMDPEVRHRSLYDVTLYRSSATLTGQFNLSALQKLRIDSARFIWEESRLLLGIDDARGLEEEVALNWGGKTMVLEAGVPDNRVVSKGLGVAVPTAGAEVIPFSMQLKLKGSQLLYFTPVGNTTSVSVAAPWKDPSFDGQYLPVQSELTDKGFKALWKVLQISRNYPQVWNEGSYDLRASSFGVRLIQPADSYAKTERSVKYALLFIALTFTVFFFVEIFQRQQVHPLQYILVGFAFCVFYTLLLSISEYAGFNTAYFIAALATVALVGFYVQGIFKRFQIALWFAIALGGLYTYIFILIQLQDYALLFGSIGLFVIIAALMYSSRKIDWYGAARYGIGSGNRSV